MEGRVRTVGRMPCPSLVLAVLATGCAGPSKLAEKSEEKLAGGDIWKAWQLATRALDREPMNPRAKSAAASAGQAISDDRQRRIHALAQGDLPRAAANVPSRQGKQALAAHRPKAAFDGFHESERFLAGYRDASRLADGAYAQPLTRIAVLAFACAGSNDGSGREIGDQWRDALADALAPPHARFTRVLGADAVAGEMTVSQLGRVSARGAVRIGRKSGAQRVVWGAVGPVSSETHVQFFRDTIARRIVQKGADGQVSVRWVDVPIEVVARVRDVQVDVDYEVISTIDGTTLVHQHAPRTTRARVVWTSFAPAGELANYSLVSDQVRTASPEHAKDVEMRWKTVCGETTTLQQVLAARREARGDSGYDRGSLGRFMAGAAFVFLQDLPPAQDLALAAVKTGWQPLVQDLTRLDAVDDVDLGAAASTDEN